MVPCEEAQEPPRASGGTRLEKPTTANRERLEAAFEQILAIPGMEHVYGSSKKNPENLAKFPPGEEVEMIPEPTDPD